MRRKEFLQFAALLSVSRYLPVVGEDELFRFDFTSINELVRTIPQEDRKTVSQMIDNLLFDMRYIFQNATPKSDLATIKKFAQEADKKFYTDRKLKAGSYDFQKSTIAELEKITRSVDLKQGEFDAMIRTMKINADKLKNTSEKFEKIVPLILKEATTAAQRAKEAEQKKGCTKVLAVIAAIVIIVVAVVVAVFTFGAGGTLVATAAISAAALIGSSIAIANAGSELSGHLVGTSTSAGFVLNGKTIWNHKYQSPVSWVELNKKMKCAIMSASTSIASSVFGNRPYPLRPIIGTLAVNIYGITNSLPGIETDC